MTTPLWEEPAERKPYPTMKTIHLNITLAYKVEATTEEEAMELALEAAHDDFPGIRDHVEEWEAYE